MPGGTTGSQLLTVCPGVWSQACPKLNSASPQMCYCLREKRHPGTQVGNQDTVHTPPSHFCLPFNPSRSPVISVSQIHLFFHSRTATAVHATILLLTGLLAYQLLLLPQKTPPQLSEGKPNSITFSSPPCPSLTHIPFLTNLISLHSLPHAL